MNDRKKTLIRTLAALTGDLLIGFAIASVCLWLIHLASLGLFLAFLVWLIAAVVGLAVSQYVIHPTVQFVLSDSKLDDIVRGSQGMTEAVMRAGVQIGKNVASGFVRQKAKGFQSFKPSWTKGWQAFRPT
jgi:hypothetical protein